MGTVSERQRLLRRLNIGTRLTTRVDPPEGNARISKRLSSPLGMLRGTGTYLFRNWLACSPRDA